MIYAHIPKPTPQTNADRIRAMSDEELAHFLVEGKVNESILMLIKKGPGLTHIQKEALRHMVYCDCKKWLLQPAEVDNG